MATVATALDGLSLASGGIRFWRCADERAEVAAVVADIERVVFRGQLAPGQVAVLLAPQALVSERELSRALQERAIPHRAYGPEAMRARTEVRDALAWLRLLLDDDDAAAAVRALIRPPIEMRHVDLAQVVQIARRRRLPIVSALPAAIESPQVPPEARERIHRFLDLHGEVATAFAQMRPERFVGRLLELIGVSRDGPLSGKAELAERSASVAWLQAQALAFSRRFPWADMREVAMHLLSEEGGDAEDEEDELSGETPPLDPVSSDQPAASGDRGVHLSRLDGPLPTGLAQTYVLGLIAADPSEECARLDAALLRITQAGCNEVVLSYPAFVSSASSDSASSRPGLGPAQPLAELERMRAALGEEWQEMSFAVCDPDETIDAALRAMRQELLDGVASIGGRLRELRLDTDVDVSHGIVRYLELVKLAALQQRPADQGIEEALADVNARLLAAVTPMQREILESSTLDEELLAGRALTQAGPALGRAYGGQPSLQRFLPRKGGGLLLSASDIETYRACPLRYKFARVLRIPLQPTVHQRFGIVLHQTLERFHASGGGPASTLLSLLDESWRRAGMGGAPQHRQLHQKAVRALERYHERLADQRAEPLWFERAFSFTIGPHRVRGRVDRVDRLPDGTYELIDYKTGAPRSEQQLGEDIQLSLYAIAARESWQLDAARQAYYYLLDDLKVPLPNRGGGPDWVRGVAIEVADSILRERFEPTPSPMACGICDYRILCPVAVG